MTCTEKPFTVKVSNANLCYSHASRQGVGWGEWNMVQSTSFSLKTECVLRGFEIIGKSSDRVHSRSLIECVRFALGTEQSVFPRLLFEAVYFPSDVQSRHFFATSGFWKPTALNSLQISIWVSKSEALNFARRNPTFTFPLYVTWSAGLIDTWKISFAHLIQGNAGSLGLWNVPAALSCLGFSTGGLVRGPGWCKGCVA